MTPEHLHHEMTIAALNAGKHVYIEKPLAHTIEEGWDIIKEWEKGEGVPGGDAEPQLVALQEGEGAGEAGDGGRHPFRARLLVSQRAAAPAVVAVRDSGRGERVQHGLEGFLGRRPSGRGMRIATSSGACTGTIRAASRRTCWCTRPTSSISCWARRRRRRAWRPVACIAGLPRTTIAMCPIT